jgi:hypothetical protein
MDSTLRIPMPASMRTERLLVMLAATASRLSRALSSLNVALGRRTTIVPGMSDRAVARLSRGQHHEEIMRWNALAHQYGATRIRI